MLTSITRFFNYHRIIAQNPSSVGLLLVRKKHNLAIPVAWEKPKVGCTKLNFDGSSKGKCGKASIGGVFRDHNAKFVLGYAQSIKNSDSTIAELAALLRGLELVLENGWTDVWLEGDAKALVNIIVKRRSMKSLEAQRINAQYPSAVGLLLVRNQHKLSIPVSWEKPKFVLGYAESIESSDNTIAELAALLRGLELIVENGWTNVWLEGNAEALVNMIVQRRTIKSSKAQRYVSRINTIIPKINNCTMTHIYREGNRAADKFAEIGHNLEKPRIWRHAPPNEVLPQDDAKGKIVLRRI
uniref:RNase H type-1 domain-containing protein n=1 Tax=Chenopodium quinoa TaxID=63459 RepID=A0A803LL45_CHEQI